MNTKTYILQPLKSTQIWKFLLTHPFSICEDLLISYSEYEKTCYSTWQQSLIQIDRQKNPKLGKNRLAREQKNGLEDYRRD